MVTPTLSRRAAGGSKIAGMPAQSSTAPLRPRGLCWIVALAVLLLPVTFAGLEKARSELVPLSLYQKVGRSPWVILGDVADGNDRFAQIKVVEVFKGSYDKPEFRLIHRLESFLRKSWEERIEFKTGERAFFFVKRYETDREDGQLEDWMKADDMFAPTFGAQGKFPVQEEGQPAYVESIREFARVSSLMDPAAQDDALVSFLLSPNPHILQAGLEQVLERRLATDAQIPTLLLLSESPRDSVRLNSLQIMEQVAEDLASAKKTLPDHQDIVNRIKGKVMGGGGDAFRAEAVKVVAAFAGEQEKAFLERLSKEDRSQLVRYEAGRALINLSAGR